MNIYNIVIIGGDIGGLHCAYNFSEYKVLLLDEKNI